MQWFLLAYYHTCLKYKIYTKAKQSILSRVKATKIEKRVSIFDDKIWNNIEDVITSSNGVHTFKGKHRRKLDLFIAYDELTRRLSINQSSLSSKYNTHL